MLTTKVQKNAVKSDLTLSLSSKILLLVTQLANSMALVLELSSWLIGFILISLIWQLSIYKQLISKPNKLVKLLVSIAGLVLLAISTKQLGLLNTMVHLMVFAYLLKPLEIHQQKEFYIQVLLGYFVIVTSLVFQQSLYFVLVVAVLTVLNTGLLLSYFNTTIANKFQLKLAASLLFKSIPVALLLFFVFPKISPFWQMPTAKNASTGLSDEVQVGDIAQLALSNDLAFRVEFEQAPPRYQQLYWRTLVLEHFDGIKWYRSRHPLNQIVHANSKVDQLVTTMESTSRPKVTYQVFAEPSYQNWLFALNIVEHGISTTNRIGYRDDFTITSNKKINSVFNYQVTSQLSNELPVNLSHRQRMRNLAIKGSNPNLIEEGKRLRALYSDDMALVSAILRNFNQENYHYTLNPPRLSNNSLDQFYFQTKSGFCEHYASSFSYLMRAAGIPARVVLGYMGGEYNAQGNYYSVYQRDAHAWSEVWITGRGWLRVDPTAAVNPARVEQGFDQILQREQSELSLDLQLFDNLLSGAWVLSLRQTLEAIDYQWTKWVVGYSAKDQLDLFNNLVAIVSQIKHYLYAIPILVLLIYVAWLFNRRQRLLNRQLGLGEFTRLSKQLAKLGLVRENAISASQYRKLAMAKYPHAKHELAQFFEVFEQIQYQAITKSEQQKKYEKLKVLLTRLLRKLRKI